jgi:hypothetical protein
MAVPEASVHQNNFPATRKYQVWFSGKVAPVQAETEPEFVYQFSHTDLGFRVFSPNGPHIFGSPKGREFIRHVRTALGSIDVARRTKQVPIFVTYSLE